MMRINARTSRGKQKNSSGMRAFTLVELMIVVILLVLLVSMAVPAYIHRIEQTRDAKARFNLQMIYMAAKGYRADFRTYDAPQVEDLQTYTDFVWPNDDDWMYTYDGGDDFFTATADRITDSRTLTIDETGTITP